MERTVSYNRKNEQDDLVSAEIVVLFQSYIW